MNLLYKRLFLFKKKLAIAAAANKFNSLNRYMCTRKMPIYGAIAIFFFCIKTLSPQYIFCGRLLHFFGGQFSRGRCIKKFLVGCEFSFGFSHGLYLLKNLHQFFFLSRERAKNFIKCITYN